MDRRTPRRFVVALGALALAMPVWTEEAGAVDLPMLYTSRRDGNQEIYAINADGTGNRRLTVDAAIDDQATWEPGQARFAWASERTGPRTIWVANADGSDSRKLTSGAVEEKRPSWSPDGQWIAFLDRGIAVARPDGSDNHVVVSNTASPSGHVAWLADSSGFVFTRSVGKRDSDVYRVNSDGTGMLALTTEPGIDRHPEASPDGQWIAFDAKPKGAKDFGIYVVRPDGTDRRFVTKGVRGAQQPTWSPDSTRIAFTSNGDIWFANLDGTGMTRVTTDRQKNESAAWGS